ncbi:4-carboxymuconolactone decarboxylase [Candidatus Kryptobacter tengchongensis]|nr:4-carboxymuconolactone decarboxylase [Candidatus Kryptobacter tengchongensis]
MKNADIKFLARVVSLVSLGKTKNLEEELKKNLLIETNLRRVEEAILQCYLFAGFPAVIEGFIVLRKLANKRSARPKDYNVNKFYLNGVKTCQKVYGENFDKLIQNMKSLHPDLLKWMLIEGYGKVLSRDVLSLNERELLNVAILTSLGWERQLYSHLKGALNVGVKQNEVIEIIETISDICGAKKANTALRIFQKILSLS